MQKVIGVGETILDILFKNQQPISAVPGGSCFNSIISLGRTGMPCTFVGYSGNDRPGRQTEQMLRDNGIDTCWFQLREEEKSAVALAYLNDAGDADYLFYKPQPSLDDNWQWPQPEAGDVLLLGSYFAICPTTHPQIQRLLQAAGRQGTTVYYDLNFRRSHQHELQELMPAILQNYRLSTIVRGSADDFEIMYGTRDAAYIYDQYIRPHCPLFLCTAGEGTVSVHTPRGQISLQAPRIPDVVSTVGAGDNFNAGLVYAIMKRGLKREDLHTMEPEQWRPLLQTAIAFAGEACRSHHNYVSRQFTASLNQKQP